MVASSSSPLFFVLLLLPLLAAAATLLGRVVKVTDGDTVHVLDSANERYKIRLAGIDAPERKQAFGKRSKEYLSSLVAADTVRVDWNKRDRYKHIVGEIIRDGRDINLTMVQDGMAWWYRKYSCEQPPADRSLYEEAEIEARSSSRGLRSDPGPVPLGGGADRAAWNCVGWCT